MSNHYPDERLVFVDLETAGVEPWRPIIQLGAIVVDSQFHELEVYEAKLRFQTRFANPKSLRKNHYSPARWATESKPAGVVLDEFDALLRRHATVDQQTSSGQVYQVAQVAAHHASFDGSFLTAWFQRFGRFLPASPRMLCTVQRAIWLFHEDKRLTPPPDFKLQTLCRYFSIELSTDDAHDALNDVRATAKLYQAMAEQAREVPLRRCG